MNKYIQLIIYFVIVAVIIWLLKTYLSISFGEYQSSGFLFNYMGVLLGFALTLYTFIVSQYQMIEARISKKYSGHMEIIKTKNHQFKEVCQEVKDDVWLIFLFLIIIVILSIIPEVINGFSVVDYINICNVSFFILSIMAIKDLIFVSFKIADFIGVNVIK